MANLILFATCFCVMVLIFGNKLTSSERFPNPRYNILWPTGDWKTIGVEVKYRNTCDFPENDMTSNSGLSLSQCVEQCKSNVDCTHFTHLDSGNKMCSLKRAKTIRMTVNKNTKSTCGYLPTRSSQDCLSKMSWW